MSNGNSYGAGMKLINKQLKATIIVYMFTADSSTLAIEKQPGLKPQV